MGKIWFDFKKKELKEKLFTINLTKKTWNLLYQRT